MKLNMSALLNRQPPKGDVLLALEQQWQRQQDQEQSEDHSQQQQQQRYQIWDDADLDAPEESSEGGNLVAELFSQLLTSTYARWVLFCWGG